MEEAKPLPSLTGRLDSITLAGLVNTLLDIYSTAEGEQLVSWVDGAAMLEQHAARALAREEAKITVSVQNLVTEMVDILEGEERAGREEAVQLANTILERLLFHIFEKEPRTKQELLCRDLLAELAGEAVDHMFPNSHFIKIAGAGHFVHTKKQDNFLSDVITFLQSEL